MNNINMKKIKANIKDDITDTEIVQFFGSGIKSNIIKYSELKNYSSLNDLLPENKSAKIILLESRLNSGHWVCIMRYNNNYIEYFDPYGMVPSKELDYNKSITNQKLNQNVKYLNNLLRNEMNQYKIIYNTTKFQKLKDDVNTCGRHCLFRLCCLFNYNFCLKSYIQFMNSLKKYYKMDPDHIVAMFIL